MADNRCMPIIKDMARSIDLFPKSTTMTRDMWPCYVHWGLDDVGRDGQLRSFEFWSEAYAVASHTVQAMIQADPKSIVNKELK